MKKKLKFWCNWCEKYIDPKEVEFDICASNKNLLVCSHKGNHMVIPKEEK